MRKRIETYLNFPRLRAKYRLASREERTKILDEVNDLTGIHRKSLIRKLNQDNHRKRKRRGLKPKYNYEKVLPVLKRIWLAGDQMCSKKLHVAIAEWLPAYEEEEGILSDFLRMQIQSISPATIDRLLKPVKAKTKRRGLGGTKPGSLLKNQIPIKVNQWDEHRPGFLEADTVAHCGNSLEGSFAWSITFTDIHTTWTENRATWNKGAEGVVHQVREVEAILPFKIRGFDCDNGSEFLNYHLIRYFSDRPKEQAVQFTRSRPYHKNDNAHVEQKNWTHVRQLLGYDRFDNARVVPLMNDLYKNEWSLYQNHFIPTMKCIKKEKINSKYRKKFDEPQTPYARVLACEGIAESVKDQLRLEHKKLNPFQLKKQMEIKLKQIFQYVHVTDQGRKRI
ncbi:MAG: integrase [Gammaproteobacteria bacterium RIFOXYB2_FULL_38_6]|nr:MAG: integrase [Gammaproteobacteria bacterium RIFOXYB2_FULL_38_6]